MRELIGRSAEKKKMQRLLQSDRAEFLVVFGRRRVGKTFLIREYYKSNIVFDFSGAYEVDKETQLENFFSEYLSRTKAQKETVAPSKWTEAFRYLADYIRSLKKSQKHIVFLDELPWLDTHKSGFIQALEYFWNQHAVKMDHLVLVVCGSANAWIQKKLLRSKGGLYNRLTQRMKLEPFTLHETELYLKSKSVTLTRYQIIELYMVMGGIPHYLNEVQPGKSAVQSIDDICFRKSGLLYDEFNQLYPSIFSQVENHLAIINALSKKPQGLNRRALIKISKLKDGGIVTRTTTELEDAGFIHILYPFQKLKRDAIYKLADFYSHFYYKFIKNGKHAGSGAWNKIAMSPAYRAWSGYAFENVCYMHMDQIKKALGIDGVFSKSSSWKHLGDQSLPGGQIDLLIDRDDQVINLCEAKFTKESFIINKAYAKKLRDRKLIFSEATKTKKAIFNTLLTTYPAIKNEYYLELIQSEVNMDVLFTKQ